MASLHAEIVNLFLLFDCVLRVAFYTGLIVVPAVLIGYENWKRGRRG